MVAYLVTTRLDRVDVQPQRQQVERHLRPDADVLLAKRQEWTLAEMPPRTAAFDARLKSLHLGCISAAVRLHLGCISALSASMPSMKYVIIAHTGTVPHGPTTGYLSTAAAVKRRRRQARRALPENCGT